MDSPGVIRKALIPFSSLNSVQQLMPGHQLCVDTDYYSMKSFGMLNPELKDIDLGYSLPFVNRTS